MKHYITPTDIKYCFGELYSYYCPICDFYLFDSDFNVPGFVFIKCPNCQKTVALNLIEEEEIRNEYPDQTREKVRELHG